MKTEEVKYSIELAKEFIHRAEIALKRTHKEHNEWVSRESLRNDIVTKAMGKNYSYVSWYGGIESGAMNRTSMELTRALARMRK